MTRRMGIFGDHDKHTNYTPYCKITYWNLHTACLPREGPTHIKVTPHGPYDFCEHEFACTIDGYHKAFTLISFIEKAYMQGRNDALAEVRKVLGVKEPRS